MKLNYIKLSDELYKVFLDEDSSYGEFYIRINKGNAFNNTIDIEVKHPDYANNLTKAFHDEMTSTCEACQTYKSEGISKYCSDHDIITSSSTERRKTVSKKASRLL